MSIGKAMNVVDAATAQAAGAAGSGNFELAGYASNPLQGEAVADEDTQAAQPTCWRPCRL